MALKACVLRIENETDYQAREENQKTYSETHY